MENQINIIDPKVWDEKLKSGRYLPYERFIDNYKIAGTYGTPATPIQKRYLLDLLVQRGYIPNDWDYEIVIKVNNARYCIPINDKTLDEFDKKVISDVISAFTKQPAQAVFVLVSDKELDPTDMEVL